MKKPAAPKPAATQAAPEGDRIAKVLSRAGVASRREAERMIELGQVAVNGKVIDSPALNVGPKDKITVNGKPLAAPEPARLWLYYKPEGLVTSANDEQGRPTVFENLPEDMPRVMSVGRLDLNSEGLLLLTNDGELKRRLELPSTGWLRKYRVRVKGNPTDPELEPLRKGITVEGETFQPMQVVMDRHQGANAWLTVGLREGKNREIRRAMNAIGLFVNRLIRVSYGPFRLGELQPGEVEEVRPKVLRDQLGMDGSVDPDERPRRPAGKPAPKPAPRKDAVPRGATDLTPAGRKPAQGRPAGKTFSRSRDDDRAEAPRGGAKAAGKPSARSGEASDRSGKPASKPFARPAPRGGDSADDRQTAKPAGKPFARSGEASDRSGKPAPKPFARPAPRGGDASGDRPTAKPAGKTFGTRAAKDAAASPKRGDSAPRGPKPAGAPRGAGKPSTPRGPSGPKTPRR